MALVVQDSKDLVRSLESGTVIEPPEVIADRAGPAAAVAKTPEKAVEKGAETASTEGATDTVADDVEGEDGLTPRQKREFTEAMRKTISRKHRQVKEAEEFAASQYNDRRLADQRVATLESELAALKQTAQKPPEVPTRPNRETFPTQEAYEDAVVDFRVKEQLAKEKQEEVKRAAEEAERQVSETAATRIRRAMEAVPDYEEVCGASEQIVPPHIGDFMRRDEKFPELAYHFAKNPKELERLAAMPAKTYADVMRVGVELDKISGKLKPFAPSAAATPGAKASNGAKPSSETESGSKQSAASDATADPSTTAESAGPRSAGPSQSRETAPVIRPLSPGSVSQVEKDPREMNTREVISDWQKRNRANLERRKRH